MKALLLLVMLGQAADAPLKDESGNEIVLMMTQAEKDNVALTIKDCRTKLETCKGEIRAAPAVPAWVWVVAAGLAGVALGVGAGYAVGQATK